MKNKILQTILLLLAGVFLSSALNAQVNMSRYITLTVQNGEDIRLSFRANEANTPVKIVSGAQEYNISVGTSWTPYGNTYNAGASTMTVYGDIIGFNCGENSNKVTGLDVSHNTALTDLRCYDNQLTILDVSQNTALTDLSCYENQLTSLDVSQNTALTTLYCYENQLTSLDVSQNTALRFLYCDENQLTSLDLSHNTVLSILTCNGNQLTSLDVSQNIGLTSLNCNENQLTSLNVSQNLSLIRLICYGNPFNTEAVDALFCSLSDRTGNNTGKIYILNNASDANHDEVLASNKQNALDKNWAVWYYDNWNGPLHDTEPATTGSYICSTIEVTGVTVSPTSATMLIGATQQITATVEPANATDKTVSWSTSDAAVATVDNNGVVTAVATGTATITVTTNDGSHTADCAVTVESVSVNMSRYITLTVQNGEDIKLRFQANEANTPVKIVSGAQEYNFSVGTSWTPYGNTYNAGASTMTVYGDIIGFYCSLNSNKVTGLDVSHNTALTYLSCSTNQLTSLDVSQNTALTQLYCNGNQLTSLDVSQNTALTQLYCYENQLTNLDVSQNTALTTLYCYENQLTNLDVSQNTALTRLGCSENQLTSLDVSQNTDLIRFWCYNNQLTSLDVSQNTALTHLYCRENQLTSLDVSQNTALTHLDCYKNPFNTEAVDALFCSLSDRTGNNTGRVYILNNASDANHDYVLASNKQNALDKNWAVWYYDNYGGTLHDTEPATTGSYICGSVTGVSLSPVTLSLEAGTTGTLTATVEPANATDKTVSWSTSDASVATVDANGVVTAVAEGTATITVTTNDGSHTADCEVTVTPAINVTGVSLTPSTLSLEAGTTGTLTETVEPANATDKTVSWSTSDAAVATVNNGVVTAVSAGTATITVTTNDGSHTADCAVTVESVNVNMSRYITLTVQNGEDIRLSFQANEANTPIKIVSGAQEYNFSVGTNWMIPLGNYNAGASTMTVYGDIIGFYCSLNSNKVTGLDVSHNTALTYLSCSTNQLTSLDVSQNTALTQLYCKGNQLTSLDVSQNTALTQLYCYENQLTSLDVSQNTALTQLGCYENQLTNLDVSHNTALTSLSCYENPFNTEAVDALFCSLSNRTGYSNGKIYILNNASDANHDDMLAANKQNALDKNWRVLYYDNEDGPLNGTEPATTGSYICGSVTGVSVNPTSTNLYIDSTQQIIATVIPVNATNQNVNWSSSDNNIATVSTNGLITGVSVGIVTIMVTTEDGGFTAGCEVTVKKALGSSDISKADNITIYPNPVNDILYMDISENNFSIELYNICGQQVLQTQNKREIYISDLPSGIYLMKITTAKGTYSHKIIKE